MDAAKFLAMLTSGALHFSRLDLLGDDFEGSITARDLASLQRLRAEDPRHTPPPESKFWYWLRWEYYVNCWHLNSHESAAMWSLYGGRDGAVAVRARYDSLAQALPDGAMIGLVTYVDYEDDSVLSGFTGPPCMYKRLSFAHEREVRAFFPNFQDAEANTQMGVPPASPGADIPVDLEKLVEAVFISPKAPDWYVGVLQDAIKKYGYDWEVHRSALDREPLF
jgi:hypothetical protein